MILSRVKNLLIAWINLKLTRIYGGRPKIKLVEIVNNFISIEKVIESIDFSLIK